MKNAITKQVEINQELTTLIDEDLKQEQELLKSLIKEILEANEKIKNAHFERVQDTEAKLKFLNTEVKRIRKTIKSQDKVVTEKRLELLRETKSDYFDTLADMRLGNAKEHFANPMRKHLADLKQSVSQILRDIHPELDDFSEPLDQYFSQLTQEINLDKDISERTLETAYSELKDTHTTIQDALNPLSEFASRMFQTFKNKLDTLLSFFDTSELDDLIDEIQSTKEDDLAQLTDQKKALEEALADELVQLNDAFVTAKREAFSAALDENGLTLSDETEKVVTQWLESEADILAHTPKTAAYKDAQKAYKRDYRQVLKTEVKPIAKAIEKQFSSKFKQLEKDKNIKRIEHLEQSYEIRMQQKERDIQAVIDMTSLKMRTLMTYLENQEETLLETFSFMESLIEDGFQLELSLITLDQTIQNERFHAFKHAQTLRLEKIELMNRYQRLVQKLETQTLSALENQHHAFQDAQLRLDFSLNQERLEIQRLYGLYKILDKRVHYLGKNKVKRMDERKDLKFQLFQDEADIALAEKEYDIQVLKAQSLYDHEKAINKVQSERVDAGVRVNKAMVQATVKRQVNFADQQIKFAEAEYAARMEHIEYTLNQELSYAEETLGYHEKNFETKREEIHQEYESKKHSIEQKKKLFEHSPMLKKVVAEEKEMEEVYQERLAAFEENLATNETIKRYREQIQKAYDYAEKARQDATELRDKDIESFNALKEESLARLANIEKMMAGTDLLPYHDEANDQAKQRLDDMIKTADQFLHEKIAEPKARLEETKERILEVEKGDLDGTTINELARQEQNLNQAYTEKIQALEATLKADRETHAAARENARQSTAEIIAALDQELTQERSADASHVGDFENYIDQETQRIAQKLDALRDNRLMKKNERLNALNRTQSTIKNRMIDTSVKTQMKVEKIENLQSKAVSTSYKLLHKQFKKDKRAL